MKRNNSLKTSWNNTDYKHQRIRQRGDLCPKVDIRIEKDLIKNAIFSLSLRSLTWVCTLIWNWSLRDKSKVLNRQIVTFEADLQTIWVNSPDILIELCAGRKNKDWTDFLGSLTFQLNRLLKKNTSFIGLERKIDQKRSKWNIIDPLSMSRESFN